MKAQQVRTDMAERKKHFLSLWMEDTTLKPRLHALANAEGRPMNNFFNHYLVPVIEAAIEKKWAALPADVKKKALEGH